MGTPVLHRDDPRPSGWDAGVRSAAGRRAARTGAEAPTPIKVCLVVENHPHVIMGGAQYQAHLLAQALAGAGDTAVTYLTRRPPRSCARSGAELPYSVQPLLATPEPRGEVLLDCRSLWRRLAELCPDVIYQRMKQSYTGVCALYARRMRIPFFFHCAHDLDVSTRWLRQFRPKKLAWDVPDTILGTWGLVNASHVIVQTERQAELLRRHFGIEAAAVIRNFQPLNPALPARPAGPTRVLWVANIKESKQPELFVRLAAAFAHRDDLEFIMVGRPGAQRRYAAFPQKAAQVRNLRYLGPLPLERVNQLMEQADIFVNTSRHEGFPNTFIQAWAHGAVVASLAVDVDAGLDRAGIGFCAGSFPRLVQLIERLSRAPSERRATAERAFAHVHAHHSMENAHTLAGLVIDAARQAQARREPSSGE